jgi:hypothetical protein
MALRARAPSVGAGVQTNTGVFSASLGALTLSGAARADVLGASASSFGALTATAIVSVAVTATAPLSLGPMSLAASAAGTVSALSTSTLAPLMFAGAGTVEIAFGATLNLSFLAIEATGRFTAWSRVSFDDEPPTDAWTRNGSAPGSWTARTSPGADWARVI